MINSLAAAAHATIKKIADYRLRGRALPKPCPGAASSREIS